MHKREGKERPERKGEGLKRCKEAPEGGEIFWIESAALQEKSEIK